MGSVKTFPGIVTAVVGSCETMLDQRDLDAAVLAQMYAEARAASERFAAEEGCTVEWSRIWNIEPVPFHPELIGLCEEAVIETGGRSHRLPSGPLHDAAEVSRCGIPSVMMFVQSPAGSATIRSKTRGASISNSPPRRSRNWPGGRVDKEIS
jgi:N-carbamoyl-L-amino-acid hydrolase